MIKNRILGVVAILSIAISLQLRGQNYADLNTQINYPASPDASSIKQYGEHPVNLQNGLVDISVPLGGVSGRKINFPLSLSYHASGIKVDQQASWVGLGWALNAGGAITRTVVGAPDEGTDGFYQNRNSMLEEDDFYTNNAQELQLAIDIFKDKKDFQPDVFYMSVPGYSVSFRWDSDGEFYAENLDNVKIEYSVTSTFTEQDLFEVTVPDGTLYRFGRDLSGNEVTERTRITSARFGASSYKEYISSWYLTAIISPDKTETVIFNYNSHDLSNTVNSGQSVYLSDQQGQQVVSSVQNSLSTIDHFGSKQLSSIIFSNGKVEFVAQNDRQDLSVPRLVRVDFFKKLGAAYAKTRSVSLDNSHYFNRLTGNKIGGGTPTAQDKKSLKLIDLTIEDESGEVVQKYGFDYNSVNLPAIETTAQDYWGYYNGQTSNGSLVPQTTHNGYTLGNANRNGSATYMKAATLEKITYPTGGYSEFHYEPHLYTVSGSATVFTGGGLRIYAVKNFDGNGNEAKAMTYKYGVNNSGTLISPHINTFTNTTFTQVNPAPSNPPVAATCANFESTFSQLEVDRFTVSSQSYVAFGLSNGAPVEYAKVTEYQGYSFDNQGKTEYNYDPSDIQVGNIGNPWLEHGIVFYPSYKSGVLKSVITYKIEGGIETVLHSKTYGYTTLGERTIRALKVVHKDVDYLGRLDNATTQFPNNFCTAIKQYLLPVNYDLVLGKRAMTSETNVTYDENGLNPVTTVRNLQYDASYLQVKEETTTGSDGDIYKSKFKYPYDHTQISGISAANLLALQKMVDLGRTGLIVEQESLNGSTVTGATRTDFIIENTDQVFPQKVWQANGANSAYRHALTFVDYDSEGNLIEYKDEIGGVQTAVIWGYNQSYPVVKGLNISHTDLSTAVNWAVTNMAGKPSGVTDLSGLLEYVSEMTSTIQKQVWSNFNLKLGEHPSVSNYTQIMTYTYDPLIGVSSQTDSNGIAGYYEYDSFGRLMWVKDNDGNIISTHEYHYKGQGQ